MKFWETHSHLSLQIYIIDVHFLRWGFVDLINNMTGSKGEYCFVSLGFNIILLKQHISSIHIHTITLYYKSKRRWFWFAEHQTRWIIPREQKHGDSKIADKMPDCLFACLEFLISIWIVLSYWQTDRERQRKRTVFFCNQNQPFQNAWEIYDWIISLKIFPYVIFV